MQPGIQYVHHIYIYIFTRTHAQRIRKPSNIMGRIREQLADYRQKYTLHQSTEHEVNKASTTTTTGTAASIINSSGSNSSTDIPTADVTTSISSAAVAKGSSSSNSSSSSGSGSGSGDRDINPDPDPDPHPPSPKQPWSLVLLKALLYALFVVFFAALGFAIPFVLMSAIYALWTATSGGDGGKRRRRRRKRGELSPYSIFNKDGERTSGGLDADEMLKNMHAGPVALMRLAKSFVGGEKNKRQ